MQAMIRCTVCKWVYLTYHWITNVHMLQAAWYLVNKGIIHFVGLLHELLCDGLLYHFAHYFGNLEGDSSL